MKAPDVGPRGLELTPVQHLSGLSDRMADRRSKAELFIEIARSDATLAKTERAAEAVTFLDRARVVSTAITPPDIRELIEGRIATVRAVAGDFDAAVAAAEQIHGDARSAALADITAEVARVRDFDRAEAMASRIGEGEARQHAWVAVIRAESEAGELDRAYDLLKHTKGEMRAEAQAAIVRGRIAKKDLVSAEKLADLIEGAHFRAEALEAVARALYQAGAVSKALRAVSRIESAWIQSRAYADLSEMARERNRKKEAAQLFERATTTAQEITDRVMAGSAFEDLGDRLIAWHREEEALALAARSPSKDSTKKVIAFLVTQQATEGRLLEAEQSMKAIATDPYWGAQALAALAEAEARAGADDRALEIAATILNPQLRLPAVARVAVIATVAGRQGTDRTPELLTRCLETGFVVPNTSK